MRRASRRSAAVATMAAVVLMGAGAPRAAVAGEASVACTSVRVWSNGVHTSLAVPAAALGPDHPLRALAPEAQEWLIGWGDRAFYQSDGTDWLLALDAALTPGPSTVHALAAQGPVEAIFRPSEIRAVAVDAAGASALAQALADAMALDADGRPLVIAEGQEPGRSWFIEGVERFHLFNVCNHWTARMLRAAGLDVAGSWWADDIMRQVAALPGCPQAER